ncbi:MAG: radical SAM protein [Desulfomonile tiedjei]|nr:radical SAM protein [Desulfomonile tiedjei]
MAPPLNKHGQHWTCRRLEGGLAFFGNQLQACCVRHHGNLGHVLLLERYDKDSLPGAEIVRARQELTARLQESGGYPRCQGCPLLEWRAPNKNKHLVDYINFAHNLRCNLECTYCNNQLGPLNIPESVPRLFPLVKGMVRDGLLDPNALIEWSGGEPTLLHEFEEMSSFLTEIGLRQSVFTNALILSTAALEWIPGSLERMYVSVDAGTRETYRRIKGKDAFDRVWLNIARYVRAGGGRVLPKMILLKENLGEVRQFVDCAERAGAQRIVVDPNSRDAELPAESVQAAAVMMEECARRGIRLVLGFSTLHSRPELQFPAKVCRSYQARIHSRPFAERLIQRVGTTKAVRHALRIMRRVVVPSSGSIGGL